MNKVLKEKIMEAFSAVLPITIIVLVISVISPVPSGTILMFMAGAVLLIVGMGFFMLGADMAMMPMGDGIGVELTKRLNLLLIIPVVFVIGFIISIAEPDLQVLGRQTPTIPGWMLISTVSIGVGLFLVIALLRILFKIPLSVILLVFYAIVFAIVFFAPESLEPFIPVGFDSGGVTTGPITVPFILALGVGFASLRGDKNSHEDSFGLVAICSVGPIIAVLLLGIFYKTGTAKIEHFLIPQAETSQDVVRHFILQLPIYFKEVSMALGALIICFIVFQLVTRRYHRHQLGRIFVGFIYTLIGLILFLTGVNTGFFPEGRLLGFQLASSPLKWLLVPLGALVGYFIVAAEPAVHVLNKQVEEISEGAISQKMMMKGLAIGMSIALTITMLRILLRIPIMYILVPGYLFALGLTFFVPKIFTGIAFDSGGVCSGPMTSTFLLPLAIGTCEGSGGDIMIDAFGIVAMVAMTPLIIIQLMGLIFSLKQREASAVGIELMAKDISDIMPEELGHITVFEEPYYG